MPSESEAPLNPLEAAHLLGITPELLFSYVRYAPKTTGVGAGLRLPATTRDGATVFRLEDLQTFDAYLREPWSEPGDDRPDVPAYVSSHLKVESGGACARCGRGYNVQTAHIEDYATGRSHHHHNLIRLCSLCHSEFDSKRIVAADEIAALKLALIDATRDRLAQRIKGPIAELRPLPLRTGYLFGREECLDRVVNALVSFRILCLHGPGGIGKTQLALYALYRWNEAARTLWLDAEPFASTSDITAALRSSMAAAVGPAAASSFSLVDEYIDVVVFDGIEVLPTEDLAKFQAFVAQLARSTRTTRIVITSQLELLEVEGIRQIHVPPLDPGASLDLVRAVAGEFATALDKAPGQLVALGTITGFADGHPLTLRLTAQLLRFFKSPSIVAQRISQFGAATIALPGRQKHTKSTSLDACLSAAYGELSDDARRTLFALSYCPAGCFSTHIPWDEFNIDDGQLAVAELNHWGLVTLDDCWTPVRLDVLSPIRSFCRIAFARDDAVEASRLFRVLAAFVETLAAVLDSSYTKPGDAGRSTLRFEQEFPNLCYVFDEAVRLSSLDGSYDRLICSLAFSLQVFCFVSGRSRRGLRILDAGVQSASRLGLAGLASSLLLQIANFSARVSDRAGASAAYEKIVALPAAEDDPELLGNVSYARAMLALADGDQSVAEIHLLEAAEFYSRSPDDSKQPGASSTPVNQRMQALALMQRAMLHEHSGRELEALRQYEQAFNLMKAINDRVNEGTVLHQMGNCHAHLRAFSEAYRCYARAARQFFELGSAIHISNSLCELGFVLLDYQPDPQASADVPADIVRAGLDDLFRELFAHFEPANSSIELDGRDTVMIRKLMGAIFLGSLSGHAPLLVEFSGKLEASLTRPLIERFRGDEARRGGMGWAISHLHVMMLLAGGLQSESRASLEEIAHHADLCYILGESSWSSFRLFDWLAIYLQRRRGRPEVTAASLHDAMDNVAWGDGVFGLST